MTNKKTESSTKEPQKSSYTMGDVFKITDDLFELSKTKQYHPGAFVHGLVFALEFTQHTYKIPPQQLAEIKRDCRRYVDEIVRTSAQKASEITTKK